jgi:hypothetical protein
MSQILSAIDEAEKIFVDAFETKLASDYQTKKEDLTLIACGPMVAEKSNPKYSYPTRMRSNLCSLF